MIRLILAGCGWWARNRTVLPFIARNSHLYTIAYITDLIGREKEFNEILNEIETINYNKNLPNVITSEEWEKICNGFENDFKACYDYDVKNGYLLKEKFFLEEKRKVLDHLHTAKYKGYVKMSRPIHKHKLRDAIEELASSKCETDCVIVNTPNVLHNDLITLALTKKYHVYSERPINPSARDASVVTLLLLAKENKKLLYSGVQRRIEDTFRYLFYCINNHIEFEDIATITIRLLSGRKITGWRNNFNLAGGGIVTDEGYHLLDMAIWILMAENADLKIYHDNVEGSVVFRDKKGNMLNGNESEVEHEAFGFLTIDNVFLNFELSYNAPLDSVFELIEVKDRNGNRIRLLRDQPQRSTNPAKIIHQRGDGSFVNVNLDYQDPVANERYLNQFKLRTESISFNSEARNFGPLQQFLENIPNCNEVLNTRPVIILGKNDCDAHFISNTDNLIKAIYRIALKH